MLAGLALSSDLGTEEARLSPVAIVGVAVLGVGQLAFPGPRKRALRAAIDAYNR